jgi:hypothetical protein
MIEHWFSINTWKWKPVRGLDLGGVVELSRHRTGEAGSYLIGI